MKTQNVKMMLAFLGALTAGALACLPIMPACADQIGPSAEQVGKITAIDGKVDILRPGESQAQPLERGTVISAGDIIRTKNSSKVELTFDDNSLVKIAENTRLKIIDYSLDSERKRVSAVLNVERGKIRATVSGPVENNNFTINTPNASARGKIEDLFVIYQKSSTVIAVLEGKASVVNTTLPGKAVDVSAGSTTIISTDQAPIVPRGILAMERKGYDSDTQMTRPQILSEKQENRSSSLEKAEGYSAPGNSNAVIIKISGQVLVRNRSSIDWHDAKIGEVLATGDAIETKNTGKLEIKIDNDNLINLQPNSRLILQKLSQDMDTGRYDNLLESSLGKIRAKVKKTNNGSRFEIKTPTAIACVRGTIMYLNIQLNLTDTYFEEGDGLVTNTISGDSTPVPNGTGSTSDGQGGVSDPAPVSESESSEWHEGWDIDTGSGGNSGGGAEGYSAQDDGANTNDTSGGVDDNTENTTDDNFLNTPFSEVPVTETVLSLSESATETSTNTQTIDESSKFSGTIISGNFGYWDSEYQDLCWNEENTTISGAFNGTQSLWTSSPSAVFTGEFSNPNNDKLWGADLYGTTVDGAAFLGTMGGTSEYPANNSLRGLFAAIYIRPYNDGYLAGYIKSTDITGSFNYDSGMFEAQGTLVKYLDVPISILPGETDSFLESNYFTGDVSGNGVSGNISGESLNFAEQNWGVWRAGFGGNYILQSSPLKLVAVGTDEFNDNKSYWFGTINGGWESNGLSGRMKGILFNPKIKYRDEETRASALTVGRIGGEITGTSDQIDSTWQALGVGEWVELADLDPDVLGFDEDDLEQFVSLPITESYSSLLLGAGGFGPQGNIGSITGSMDLSLYENTPATKNIWTAFINGSYSGPTSNDWTLALNNDGTNATLSGTQWSDGKWLADVTGAAPDNIAFSGQAGGTYAAEAGTFEGIGAGTWTQGSQ